MVVPYHSMTSALIAKCYTLHPTIQGPLGNLKKPDMQGLFWFFLKSDASGIGAAVIYRMHALGVKAHAESNQIRNKC